MLYHRQAWSWILNSALCARPLERSRDGLHPYSDQFLNYSIYGVSMDRTTTNKEVHQLLCRKMRASFLLDALKDPPFIRVR
jgi:hypothetical protein